MENLLRSLTLFSIFVLFSGAHLLAQSVGINTLTPDPSTELDVRGTTQMKFNSFTGQPHLWLREDGNDFTRLYFSNNTPDMRWSIGAKLDVDTTSSTLNFFLSGAGDVLRLKGSKRVGINADPSDGLHVKVASGENAMRVQVDGLTKMRVYANGGTSIGANNESGTVENGLYVSGNTGMGVNNPTEKLEVDGAIVLGESNGPKEGAIRYENGDFEGYTGTKWVSLTKPQAGEWGEVPQREIAERQFVPNPNFETNCKLRAVSISGNYVIAGSPSTETGAGTFTGSAHIFHLEPQGTWSLQSNLLASDGAQGDQFGDVVAIDGDYAVISRYNLDKAYVFKRNGVQWTEEAILQPSDLVPGDNFGSAISIDGEYIAVSSPSDDSPGSINHGSVYIFKKNGNVWEQESKVLVPNSNNLGNKITLSGNKLATHSFFSTDSKVILFERVGTSWIQDDVIEAPSNTIDFGFRSLQLSNDTLLTGSQGKSHIFINDGIDWVQSELFFNAESTVQYGRYCAFSGSYVIIGDRIGSYVDLFNISGPLREKVGTLIPSQELPNFNVFGFSQDIDGDHIVVCPHDTVSGSDYGLYFYSRNW